MLMHRGEYNYSVLYFYPSADWERLRLGDLQIPYLRAPVALSFA